MAYCGFGQPIGTARVVANTSGTVSVAVSPSSGACASTTLPNGTYDIRWEPGVWDQSNPGINECGGTTDIGDITVVNGSGGPTTSNSFNPGDPGTIQICVTRGVYGMQVPVSVVAAVPTTTTTIPTTTPTTSPDECPEEDDGETTWESSDPSSRQLGTNLGAPPATGGPYDAHHVVPGKAKIGASARAKLVEQQIDINDADNGLWHERTKHRCQHTKVYYDEVSSRVSAATNQATLRAILRDIADEIRAGTFPR